MATASAKKAAPAFNTPAEGSPAPEFTLAIAEGKAITLAELKGKKVVLYFYPKDDTPGCTIEAKDFAALMPEFEKEGTVIIGVSKDSLKSHGKFKEKFCLPFILGSDEGTTTAEDYGVWVEKSMYGKKYFGIERTTLLIDATGTIRNVWNKVKIDNHAQEVLNAVKALA